MVKKITVIGDGGWGTTLSLHLARKGCKVMMWGAFADYVAQMEKTRENIRFLPGFKLPLSVRLTADIKEAIAFGDMIVLALPSEYLIPTLARIKACDQRGKVYVSVIKGLHPVTFKRMSQIIEEHLPKVKLAVLSGPTIALEVARQIPTTAVAASRDLKLAKAVQAVFNSPSFRIYTNSDIIGVEIGGSIKNVIALACGICDGMGLGTNAKAAILTRGLAEITRLGTALGGRKETFYGLAGLGDLATTCFSPNSRNRSVGEQIGRGKSVKAVLKSMQAVAEGVVTSKAAYRLSVKMKIPMPIVREVYRIVFEGKSARKAVADLMTRSLKSE